MGQLIFIAIQNIKIGRPMAAPTSVIRVNPVKFRRRRTGFAGFNGMNLFAESVLICFTRSSPPPNSNSLPKMKAFQIQPLYCFFANIATKAMAITTKAPKI